MGKTTSKHNERIIHLISSVLLGILGLAFILISIFDSGAGTWALIIGLLNVALGNILNVIRMQQNKKSQEG